MSKYYYPTIAWAVLGALTLLLSACVGNGVIASRSLPANVLVWEVLPHGAVSQVEPALKENFESYWTHYYWRDSESRYALESDAFRKRYASEFYKDYYQKAWSVKEIVVQEIANQEKGGVGFKLKMVQKNASGGKVLASEFWDIWIKEEGVWHHKHNDPILPY